MVALLALLLSAAGSPPERAELRARATVTIVRPHLASPKSWDPAANRHQKEVIEKDEGGRVVRLRLTEFE